MTKQYSFKQLSTTLFIINERTIDPTKGIISFNGKAETVEPKVMQVLLILAAAQGELVSQEALFSQVWPDSIFSPGSIRRCIAVLRKLLDDPNATNSVITTHPKRGYSLNSEICLVQANQRFPKLIAILTALVVISLLAMLAFRNKHTPSYQITAITPVTTSEQQEYNSKMSPDGKSMAFLRDSDNPTEQGLWLQSQATEREDLLVQGDIRTYAWAPSNGENKKIAFSLLNNGKESIQLIILGTAKPQLISHIQDEKRLSSLHWSKTNTLYYLARNSHALHLTALDINTGQSFIVTTFSDDFLPYELNLAPDSNQLALIGFDRNGHSRIKLLALNNTSSSTRNIKQSLQQMITLNENRYFISWHPDEDSLLLSDGRALSIVSLDGQQTELNYENFDFAQFPAFTTDGKAILLTQGKFDIDILFAETNSDNNQKKIKTSPLINTNTVDRAAALSPDKRQFAFISHRKGFPQLYLYNIKSQKTTLVYENPKQLLGLSKPVWHPSGKQLAFANYEFPIIVTLDNNSYTVEQFDQPLGVPIDWFTSGNELLTLSRKNSMLSKVNIETKTHSQFSKYHSSKVILDNHDNLLYLDKNQLIKITRNGKTPVISIQEQILDITKEQNKLHLLVKQTPSAHSQGYQLINYELTNYQEISRYPMPQRTDRLSATTESGIIFEVSQYQKDIIRLALTHD